MPEITPETSRPAEGLHVCPCCDSGMVQPLAWEPATDRRSWRVWRRCPECGWRGDAIHAEAAIEAYDEQLDRDAHELAAELRKLQHANMAAMADAFVAALEADLIGADDFAWRPAHPTPA